MPLLSLTHNPVTTIASIFTSTPTKHLNKKTTNPAENHKGNNWEINGSTNYFVRYFHIFGEYIKRNKPSAIYPF